MARHPLRRLGAEDLSRRRGLARDPALEARVAEILASVREGGETALRRWATELDGLGGGPLFYGPADFRRALEGLRRPARDALERAASRIAGFARAQLGILSPLELPIPGGRAGHDLVPVERAGCYAPGGRHPLPSSVLMTALPARAAGVESVWMASPRPAQETLAACALAEADGLVAAGGAQAIGALAYGAGPIQQVDRLVGPGNAWVAAAKRLVAGEVQIDSIAGPSELLIIADEKADPGLVAADLLAQAEHDTEALPLLFALSEEFVQAVEESLHEPLQDLPEAETAKAALAKGGAFVNPSLQALLEAADIFAPEHLAIHAEQAEALAARVRHAGAVFIGSGAAEALGDYGAGPNHVLPTGAAARMSGGLSALAFLRVRTWIRMDDPIAARELYRDTAMIARLEGLEAHARSAEGRAPVGYAGGKVSQAS